MVKLELELTDIDYDFILNEYVPRIAEKLRESGSPLASLLTGGLTTTLFLSSPDSVKDRVTAELINLGSSRLERKMQEMAAQNGIPGKVQNLRATAVSDEPTRTVETAEEEINREE
ncbi:MAG: hypothetical protein IJT62_08770 [Oscillospiraceae bacterium]|nr:hypothetical protein [Oscillospiraceae bacterium]